MKARVEKLVLEGSKREIQFNDFWNKNIGARDTKIKAHFLEGAVFFLLSVRFMRLY